MEKKKIIDYFDRLLDRFGNDPRSADWNSKEAQYLRFEMISQVGDISRCSILDVGCGLGHFYEFLKEKDLKFEYKGIDISKKMIAQARRRLPDLDFEASDILSDEINENFDIIVTSGMFNAHVGHSYDEWTKYCEAVIIKMFRLSKKAISFNMVTNYVDFKVEHLYYADPKYYFDFAKKLSRFVTLRHDYPIYDFVIYIYKEFPFNLK